MSSSPNRTFVVPDEVPLLLLADALVQSLAVLNLADPANEPRAEAERVLLAAALQGRRQVVLPVGADKLLTELAASRLVHCIVGGREDEAASWFVMWRALKS